MSPIPVPVIELKKPTPDFIAVSLADPQRKMVFWAMGDEHGGIREVYQGGKRIECWVVDDSPEFM
jgi:hypothetical protein